MSRRGDSSGQTSSSNLLRVSVLAVGSSSQEATSGSLAWPLTSLPVTEYRRLNWTLKSAADTLTPSLSSRLRTSEILSSKLIEFSS